MRIFLWGMMGSGKTFLAKEISKQIPKLYFVDLDNQIEKQQKITIPQIFSRFGEYYFRQVEHQTLKQIIYASDDFVMATGGGTPVFFNNADLMYSSGLTIYLYAPVKVLAQRLWNEKDNRPLISNAQDLEQLESILTNLLNRRSKYYQKAHIIWDISRPFQELIDKLKLFLRCDK